MTDPRVLNPDAGRDVESSRLIAYPPWMDGRYVTAASKVTLSAPIVIPPAGIVMIPGNPLRWALGILAPGALLDTMAVSVDPRPDLFPIRVSAAQGVRWMSLFEYGPCVTYILYVFDSAGITFKYLEVEV